MPETSDASGLTVEEVLALSQTFTDVSRAVGQFVDENFHTLPPDDRARLDELKQDLVIQASTIRTDAVGLMLDQAQAAVGRLKAVTAHAQATLAKLKNVQKAIGIATAALQLASAIAARDPGKVVSAVTGLVKQIQA